MGLEYRYQISIFLWRGAGQSGQGLLVLPPRCEIFLVRTLYIVHIYGTGNRSK